MFSWEAYNFFLGRFFAVHLCIVASLQTNAKAYSEPSWTSKTELFVKTVRCCYRSTIFGKSAILDVHWVSNTPLKMIARNTLHKKWSFPLRISEVNVTKSAVSTGFVTSTEENLEGKLHFCVVTYGGCKSMWRFESNRKILKNRTV